MVTRVGLSANSRKSDPSTTPSYQSHIDSILLLLNGYIVPLTLVNFIPQSRSTPIHFSGLLLDSKSHEENPHKLILSPVLENI